MILKKAGSGKLARMDTVNLPETRLRAYPPTPHPQDEPDGRREASGTHETFEEGLELPVCNVRSRVLVVIILPGHLLRGGEGIGSRGLHSGHVRPPFLLVSPKDQGGKGTKIPILFFFNFLLTCFLS